MKAKGNGAPEQCVANLILTVRGEVPYERLKGVDATLIDRPSERAAPLAVADVGWLIETYEPRADITNINVKALIAGKGQFGIDVDISNQ